MALNLLNHPGSDPQIEKKNQGHVLEASYLGETVWLTL